MLSWWGKAKKDTTTEAILGLRELLETLQKKEAFSQNKRDQQEQLARKLVTTNKAAARNALRKKKQYEEEVEKLENQMLSVEHQLSALESANMNRETVRHMKLAADAMRSVNKDLDIDKLDETMDSIRDQLAMNEEISNAIAQPVRDVDDAQLEAELELLGQETLDESLVHAGTAPSSSLPEVPKQKLDNHTTEEDEEEALRQLEAEMAA